MRKIEEVSHILNSEEFVNITTLGLRIIIKL